MSDTTNPALRTMKPEGIINGKPATAHSLLAALIDIYDDERKYAPEDRCYVEEAWPETVKLAREFLATPVQQEMAPLGFVRQVDVDDFFKGVALIAKSAEGDWQVPVYLAAPAQAAIDAREKVSMASKMEVESWRRSLLVWREASHAELIENTAGLKQCLSNAARLLLDHPSLASRDAAPAPAAAGGVTDEILARLKEIRQLMLRPNHSGDALIALRALIDDCTPAPALVQPGIEVERQRLPGNFTYSLRDAAGDTRVGDFPITAEQFNAIAATLEAALVQPAPDPMDWPLPCDVTVGHGTMRKGVSLRILVMRMKSLYEMATGNDADTVANRTPEERKALADKFLAAIHDKRPLHEKIAEVRRNERPSAELLNTIVGAAPVQQEALQEAHRLGFLRAAGWMQCDKLFADVNGSTYRKDRDHDVATIALTPPAVAAPAQAGETIAWTDAQRAGCTVTTSVEMKGVK